MDKSCPNCHADLKFQAAQDQSREICGYWWQDRAYASLPALALVCAIAIVLSSIIDGLYDMGEAWSAECAKAVKR